MTAECPLIPIPWRYAWVFISMSTPNADAWELAGFPGRLDVAAYLDRRSAGADLHRWLRRKIDEDAVSTSAAAFAPAIIAERLDDTIGAIGQRDLGQAAQSWAQVRTTLKDMAEAASIWQSRMASALAGAPDADKMSRLRETLIVATVRRAIPGAKLWRFEARPPGLPRYEEQDLPCLLQDLRRNSA